MCKEADTSESGESIAPNDTVRETAFRGGGLGVEKWTLRAKEPSTQMQYQDP